MAGYTYDPTTKTITVHGRSSAEFPIESFADEAETQYNDISQSVFRFEVDGIPIAELAVAHPTNPLAQIIKLERTQISMLKKSNMPFSKAYKASLIDETRAAEDIYEVIWAGFIQLDKDSYVGAADTTVEE